MSPSLVAQRATRFPGALVKLTIPGNGIDCNPSPELRLSSGSQGWRGVRPGDRAVESPWNSWLIAAGRLLPFSGPSFGAAILTLSEDGGTEGQHPRVKETER